MGCVVWKGAFWTVRSISCLPRWTFNTQILCVLSPETVTWNRQRCSNHSTQWHRNSLWIEQLRSAVLNVQQIIIVWLLSWAWLSPLLRTGNATQRQYHWNRGCTLLMYRPPSLCVTVTGQWQWNRTATELWINVENFVWKPQHNRMYGIVAHLETNNWINDQSTTHMKRLDEHTSEDRLFPSTFTRPTRCASRCTDRIRCRENCGHCCKPVLICILGAASHSIHLCTIPCHTVN